MLLGDYTLNGRSVATICDQFYPGSQPVSIHHLDLDAFIAENLVHGETAWLGLHRPNTDADWSWLDGSPVNFTMWINGEPNHSGEACVGINWQDTGFWDDSDCDTLYKRFVCQIDSTE